MKFCLSGSKSSLHYRSSAGCQVDVSTCMHCHTWRPYIWLKQKLPCTRHFMLCMHDDCCFIAQARTQLAQYQLYSIYQVTFHQWHKMFYLRRNTVKSLARLHHSGLQPRIYVSKQTNQNKRAGFITTFMCISLHKSGLEQTSL